MAATQIDLGRALTELEASRARVERDAARVCDDMRSKLAAELLPVLDNLDRTIRAAEDAGDAPAVLEGARMVRAQLEGVLRGYGVERLDSLGAPFDPVQHEAVAVLPVTDPAWVGRVIDQPQPGYRFGERLLRPAQVVVGQAAAR